MATTPLPVSVKVIDTQMYVCVDSQNNNNKFWKYERLNAPISAAGKKGKIETGDLRITWGRVGEPGESQLKMWDEKFVLGKIKEKTRATKEREAYSIVNTISTEVSPRASAGQPVANEQIKRIAVAEIAGGCPTTAALVKRLAETNKHQLIAATGGRMDIDLSTGIVTTALGVVTLDAVKEARQLLDKMAPFVTKHDTENSQYPEYLDHYLRLVPQNVGTRKRGWGADFIELGAQTQLLDQLETSVELAEQRLTKAITDSDTTVKRPTLFECKLSLVEDDRVWERIKKAYYDSMNQVHSSSRLKPVRVYAVTIPHMNSAFEADGRKVGNIKRLWHGTRVFNVLSIMKRGFVLPKQLSSVQTTGAMFGNGVYFSDQSTKSLNYSYGYWGGGGYGRDSNCFMFHVDVAMGHEYIPSGPGNGNKQGYDSCFAKASRSGVMNNEMIVYRTSQANICHLVEFNDR
jgi:poly [ADP-ribose] polymerase